MPFFVPHPEARAIEAVQILASQAPPPGVYRFQWPQDSGAIAFFIKPSDPSQHGLEIVELFDRDWLVTKPAPWQRWSEEEFERAYRPLISGACAGGGPCPSSK